MYRRNIIDTMLYNLNIFIKDEETKNSREEKRTEQRNTMYV